MPNPQLTRSKGLHHFLSTEGLPRVLLLGLLERIDEIVASRARCAACRTIAVGKPRRLSVYGLDTLSLCALDVLVDGGVASLVDRPVALQRADTPAAIAARATDSDILILRHPESGAAHAVARHLPSGVRLINVEDGMHAAPIDALHDVMQLRHRHPRLHETVVTLTGDLIRSGRLRSLVHALTTLGVPEVRVIDTPIVAPQRAVEPSGVVQDAWCPTLSKPIAADVLLLAAVGLGVRRFAGDDAADALDGSDAALACVAPLTDVALRAAILEAVLATMDAAV